MDPLATKEAEAAARFARALHRLEAELDWERLGALYCHEGGEAFFPPEQVDALRDAGLALAGDLGQALEGLGAARARRGGPDDGSLYVGAAVAELVPMLFEVLVLGREVRAVNLAGEEPALLDRALEAAEREVGRPLPRIDVRSLEDVLQGGGPRPPRFGHVWITSVLTDPVEFPALHARLYGRGEPEAADEARERERARELFERLLRALARPGLLTTTDEELQLILPMCRARGDSLHVPDRARLSSVVGDPVRFTVLGAER